MPEQKSEKALRSYELSGVAFLLATVLCGVSAILRPSLIEWAIGLFLLFGALSAAFGAYLLVRHEYQDPRFKMSTLLVWTSGTVFVFATLWVQYGMG